MEGKSEFMSPIEAVVANYCEAIHSQNEAAMRSLWTGDATDMLISQSTAFEGPDAIARDFLGLLGNAYESIRLVNEGLSAHLLTDDVAVVVFRYHTECIRRATGEPYGIVGLETQIMRRMSGQWKIAHVQYHGKDIQS